MTRWYDNPEAQVLIASCVARRPSAITVPNDWMRHDWLYCDGEGETRIERLLEIKRAYDKAALAEAHRTGDYSVFEQSCCGTIEVVIDAAVEAAAALRRAA